MHERSDTSMWGYVNNRADHAPLEVNPTEERKSNELLNNSYGVVEVMVMEKTKCLLTIFHL